uniref:Uncharacterized protein n=1 Tax=Cacopsylla melanoneura TaxID=428564 RepID=A0A8D8SUX2_9HEMI
MLQNSLYLESCEKWPKEDYTNLWSDFKLSSRFQIFFFFFLKKKILKKRGGGGGGGQKKKKKKKKGGGGREEQTSELQSPYVSSYAVFCLKKKKRKTKVEKKKFELWIFW